LWLRRGVFWWRCGEEWEDRGFAAEDLGEEAGLGKLAAGFGHGGGDERRSRPGTRAAREGGLGADQRVRADAEAKARQYVPPTERTTEPGITATPGPRLTGGPELMIVAPSSMTHPGTIATLPSGRSRRPGGFEVVIVALHEHGVYSGDVVGRARASSLRGSSTPELRWGVCAG
jgi:hypothetical protein